MQGLSVYEKRKYVWKMLYIYMLGYDVDFGHMETVALISAAKYAEKQVCLIPWLQYVVVLMSIFLSTVRPTEHDL